ncbi:MAG: LUD domain-containing protein [Alphaproteobacteria bacterium]|nr:LUD domain-containing protein [Alphaproteobacteria bacterium]
MSGENGNGNPGKEAILGAIRRGLRRGPLPADQQALLAARIATHPRHLIPARSRLPRPAQVELFLDRVVAEFGTVARVADAAAVPQAVADYLAQANLPPSIAMAPHPLLAAMPWAERPMLAIRQGRAAPADQAGLTAAFAAIAETGTLMLPSGAERPTTLNIMPETGIVVVQASRIVGAYEEAWDLLRREAREDGAPGTLGPRFMPRNVMLITGPSRTADIEQTIELGAHGPRRLHVVLIDDDPAAR